MMRARASVLVLAIPLVPLAGACTQDHDPPRQVLPLPADPNFSLYVSNQSFDIDPVDVQVSFDGQLALTGDFLVEGQHSWHRFDFKLAPGSHEMRSTTDAGGVEEIAPFDTTAAPRYGVLAFWFYPPGSEGGVDPTPPQFSFDVLDEPPLFD
jgi:hypothetical protein